MPAPPRTNGSNVSSPAATKNVNGTISAIVATRRPTGPNVVSLFAQRDALPDGCGGVRDGRREGASSGYGRRLGSYGAGWRRGAGPEEVESLVGWNGHGLCIERATQ